MNSCGLCKKKSSVIINCSKCKYNYCTSHLLPEVHNCTKLEEFKNDAYDLNKAKLLKEATKVSHNFTEVLGP